MDQKSLIAIFMFDWTLVSSQTTINPPNLFGKEEKLDKLIIKNQIAYHFKKVVREVNQELFVSRKVDVSLLFKGLDVLNRTASEVQKLCNGLPSMASVISKQNTVAKAPTVQVVHVDQQGRALTREPFTLVSQPIYASFKEAKALCEALGKQLPEIYTVNQRSMLVDFLNKNNLAQCFAGIEPDLSDAIPRYISTQYPIWKTVYTQLNDCAENKPVSYLDWAVDDGHAKYLYTSDNLLCVSRDIEGSPIWDGQYANTQYREKNKVLNQLMTRVVCSPRWDGRTDINPPVDNLNRGGITVKARYTRSMKARKLRRSVANSTNANIQNVQTLCFGVADQAKESFDDMQSKLTDLLALIDITVHSEIVSVTDSQDRHREKRVIPLFLMKFIFVTGVKMLWQLFGFVQKVRMNNRLKNIESMLQTTNDRSNENSNAISSMTKLITGNAYAIKQLNIRVDGLENRISMVEAQVETLKDGLAGLAYRLETVTVLATIDNLVVRTKRSLDSGYDILKDIIHSSKLRQTSPLVLPLDQIELVQTEISKVSTAVLDPDFAKMQSIVVSDPNDSTKLLVVVNMAALGRRNLELVHMIPVPYYEAEGAYAIILDYQNIVLDQSTYTFSILTKQEEYDCLLNRCYVGSSEQSLLEKSCGIPQFYDRHKDGCVSESVTSTGVYLKPMLPDGVIFAFRDEVRSEVFCKNKPIGKSRYLRGTGILQLPNGCVLQVVDKDGKVTKVKGQPQYTMVSAGNLDLMQNGPLSALHSEIETNNTQKVSTVDAYVESRVSSVIRQVEQVDNKMLEQHTHVWILTGAISLTVMLTLLAVYLLYRFSTRARRKIRDIRGNFSELTRKVLETEIDAEERINSGNPEDIGPTAPPPQRKRDALKRAFREQRQRAHFLSRHRHPADLESQQDVERERSYMSMNELSNEAYEARYISRPLSRPNAFKPLTGLSEFSRSYSREYPRIPTPLLKEAQDYELERLKGETELVEELSEVLSPRPTRRDKIETETNSNEQ